MTRSPIILPATILVIILLGVGAYYYFRPTPQVIPKTPHIIRPSEPVKITPVPQCEVKECKG